MPRNAKENDCLEALRAAVVELEELAADAGKTADRARSRLIKLEFGEPKLIEATE